MRFGKQKLRAIGRAVPWSGAAASLLSRSAVWERATDSSIVIGMSEKRSRERNRVYKAGKIIFNDRYSVVDCAIKDISATGAKLKLSTPMLLPETFELRFVGEQRTIKAKCRWTRGNMIGVEFLER